jgi:homocysteine S-methyltransferase
VTVNERQRFRERLARAPVLLDGGVGTLLFASGVPQRACLDELASTRPDLVGSIHRAYVAAGAEIIETASFGANRIRLAAFGLAPQTSRLNRRAAQVAREARDVAGREVLVGGSIGPLGAPTRDVLHLDDEAIRAAFREQIDGLLEGGVDLFMIETFVDLRHLLLAVEEARKASDHHPIVAQMTFGEELELADGSSPEDAVRILEAAAVDAIGVNCGAGPHACIEALERFGPAGLDAPARSIVPNAGLPQRVEGQFVYAAGPDYFGQSVARMIAAGASLVGGCCGTTPDHTAAMRAALDSAAASLRPLGAPATESPPETAPARPSIVEQARGASGEGDLPPTQLLTKLRAGHYVVSVEIDPPRSIRIDRTIDAARLLRDAGVDLVNVSDSAMARVRMGAMAVAFGIQHDLDLECLVHFTTRDRNLMAIESELLGAHALGVRNILALTGDPPRVGDYATGSGVWDVDSIGLVEVLSRLNRGEDQAGSPIGQPATFTIACALDPTAADSAAEWDRLERKLAAGAHLVMTQPLYGIEQVDSMFEEARRRFGEGGVPVPLLLGVLPLQSARHAEFLHHEVPGITIPDETRAAMHAAGESGAEVGLEQSLALLEQVGDAVAGTYIMPSFGRYEQCAELVRRIRTRHGARATA